MSTFCFIILSLIVNDSLFSYLCSTFCVYVLMSVLVLLKQLNLSSGDQQRLFLSPLTSVIHYCSDSYFSSRVSVWVAVVLPVHSVCFCGLSTKLLTPELKRCISRPELMAPLSVTTRGNSTAATLWLGDARGSESSTCRLRVWTCNGSTSRMYRLGLTFFHQFVYKKTT